MSDPPAPLADPPGSAVPGLPPAADPRAPAEARVAAEARAAAEAPAAAEARAAARRAGARSRERPSAPAGPPADPVARVLVDTGLAHLDRPFDYAVPAELADQALPGTRVKVRFAGTDRDGFVVERVAEPLHDGRLQPLRRVVSPEPVLTPAVLATAREVARLKAGAVMDVLRLAVPPRHAAAERALNARLAVAGPPAGVAASDDQDVRSAGSAIVDGSAWADYPAGAAFLARVADGQAPGATWLALPHVEPDLDWPMAMAQAAAAARAAGRGAVLVLPDRRDVDRVDRALVSVLGSGQHVRLTADQGPQARYTAFLRVLRGDVRVVVGTRSAALAPVVDLGLVAWWDDGDDLHDEPRAPYPHVRDLLLTRARVEGAAVLSGGFARTVTVEQLRQQGVLADVSATREVVRLRAPRVEVAGESDEADRDPAAASARLPSLAWRVAKAGLELGPVLVQVPRRGYVPALACQTCRRPARCGRCAGPLGQPRPPSPPTCRWCGTPALDWTCPTCGGHRLRATVVGARRTAEELGRAFPGIAVHTSGAGEVLAGVGTARSLVIATPGAEPVATGGYAAALLLDAWALLDRPTLDAGEEALRRWLAAAALVRSAPDGGRVVLVGANAGPGQPPVEALVTWRPGLFAERELAERSAVGLPPGRVAVVVEGERGAVRAALTEADLPAQAQVLGPQSLAPQNLGRAEVPGGSGPALPTERAVVLAPLAARAELAEAWHTVRAVRSARKEPGRLTIRFDPAHLDV